MNPTYRNLDDCSLEVITIEPDADVIFRAASPIARTDVLLTLDDQAHLIVCLAANLTEARPTPTVEDAAALAARLHEGATYGEPPHAKPYIMHAADVARLVSSYGPHAMMVGWLHAAVQDTPCTLAALRLLGYPEEVVDGIDAVTHRKAQGETYQQYIHRAARHPLGRPVKKADNHTNTENLHRIETQARRNFLTKRYSNARAIIALVEANL